MCLAQPPPVAKVFSDQRAPPNYAHAQRFFGQHAYQNMGKHAEKVARSHFSIKPFAEPTSIMVVVYTDCIKFNISHPRQPTDEGMWFPCLAVCRHDGQWITWCVAAAESSWGHGWETDPSRIHMYKPKSSTVVIEEVFD